MLLPLHRAAFDKLLDTIPATCTLKGVWSALPCQEVHAVSDRALLRGGAHHLLHAGALLLHAARLRGQARLQARAPLSPHTPKHRMLITWDLPASGLHACWAWCSMQPHVSQALQKNRNTIECLLSLQQAASGHALHGTLLTLSCPKVLFQPSSRPQSCAACMQVQAGGRAGEGGRVPARAAAGHGRACAQHQRSAHARRPSQQRRHHRCSAWAQQRACVLC